MKNRIRIPNPDFKIGYESRIRTSETGIPNPDSKNRIRIPNPDLKNRIRIQNLAIKNRIRIQNPDSNRIRIQNLDIKNRIRIPNPDFNNRNPESGPQQQVKNPESRLQKLESRIWTSHLHFSFLQIHRPRIFRPILKKSLIVKICMIQKIMNVLILSNIPPYINSF